MRLRLTQHQVQFWRPQSRRASTQWFFPTCWAGPSTTSRWRRPTPQDKVNPCSSMPRPVSLDITEACYYIQYVDHFVHNWWLIKILDVYYSKNICVVSYSFIYFIYSFLIHIICLYFLIFCRWNDEISSLRASHRLSFLFCSNSGSEFQLLVFTVWLSGSRVWVEGNKRYVEELNWEAQVLTTCWRRTLRLKQRVKQADEY